MNMKKQNIKRLFQNSGFGPCARPSRAQKRSVAELHEHLSTETTPHTVQRRILKAPLNRWFLPAATFISGLLFAALFLPFQKLSPDPLIVKEAKATEGNKEFYQDALSVQEAFRQVVAQISPSVVEIAVENEQSLEDSDSGEQPWDDFFKDFSDEEQDDSPHFYRSNGLGSGVIVKRDGNTYYILSNAHVIGNAVDIQILFYNGLKETGHLVGRDERKDLALIKVQYDDAPLPVPVFGDSDKLYVGDWVLAFGSPFGYEQSVSYGIISALERRSGPGESGMGFIQTDASINQGNSGGPLVNIKGELIGINTFITTPGSGSIGLGFAIPVNNIISTIKQLIESGEVRYGWLGVSLGDYSPEAAEDLGYPLRYGALIYQVFYDSPAWHAGLRAGDLLLAVDNRRREDYQSFIYMIGDKIPGDTVIFSIDRQGKSLELSATIGVRQDEESVQSMHSAARPGFIPAPLDDELRDLVELPEQHNGITVSQVYPRTPAHAVDLRSGDIILEVEGKPVETLAELYGILGKTTRENPSFKVFRNGETITLQKRNEGAL